MTPSPPAQPLARAASLKLKLGLLVAASVTVAAAVGALGSAAGVPVWLSIPVTIAVALAVTQLLAVGMTSPLRDMTAATRRMASGDYAVRVPEGTNDEVGILARSFNTMAHELATVDRQRRDLVANVSHELRTPLTALQAVLENLVDGVAPRDPDTLAAALAQSERLGSLVEDLLDLARVDAGKAPFTPEPVLVAFLLSDAVQEMDTMSRAVSYAIRVTPHDLVLEADPARLHQLVANLLDNASRHTPAGTTVAVVAEQHDDWLVLEVQDQGPGVAPGDRERVFEPFGTLGADPASGGTGLGLAIVRWVTDLHGGRVGFVDPEPGSTGARVRVELPLRPTGRPDRPDRIEAATVPAAPSAPPAPPAPSRPEASPPVSGGDVLGSFWPERHLPARLSLLLGAAGTGLVAALVLVGRDLGLGTFLVLLAAGGVVLGAARHRRDPFTLACAALCVLLAVTTVVRDAEWIVVLCLLAGATLFVCGVTRARTLLGFVLSGVSWPLAGLRGLPWLGRTLGVLTGLRRGAAVLRTAVWSLTGLVVFTALFASADALLAEWVDVVVPDLRVDTVVARMFVAAAVGGSVLAAGYLALNPPRVDRQDGGVPPVAHRFEWLAPVMVVVGVFAAFLAAQAAVVFGGHGYLQRTTGLTYAEYVHQGFGQLTVATALTLLVIWAAARKAPRATTADRAWLRAALGLLCLETLVVVASALHRMHVYQEAYGFTRLRLLVDVFEGWLGLLVVAVLVGGIALRAAWLPRFALVSGCVALLGLAVVDPDAWIAGRNVDRYVETGRVDWAYLRGLSDDAVPVLAELPAESRSCALGGREAPGGDWLEWNLGSARAASALDEVRGEQPGEGPYDCAEPS
jgi:two-component system, OmpR family, sensor histidine kinase BaeS